MKATQQHEQHKGKSGGPGVGEGVEEGEDITKFGRRIPFFNAPKVASVSVTDEQQRAAFESPSAIRQRVLHETLRRLGTPRKRRLYRATALDNLKRWARAAKAAKAAPKGCGGGGGNKAASEDASSPSPSSAFTSSSASAGVTVTVLPGDWGTVTQQVTKEHGKMFAVLNMANAYVFGGGYVEGMVAQEENMFRRTDCHFSVSHEDFNQNTNEYSEAMTKLVSGADGFVELDATTPRVCIRGQEERDRSDMGYQWLAKEDIFPFLELRAAACDLRGARQLKSGQYDQAVEAEMAHRIEAQLSTLKRDGVRCAVLSAFGCGAFRNPAKHVAALYRRAIEKRQADFDVIVFAIFNAGYGPDNFTPFKQVFSQPLSGSQEKDTLSLDDPRAYMTPTKS